MPTFAPITAALTCFPKVDAAVFLEVARRLASTAWSASNPSGQKAVADWLFAIGEAKRQTGT